jgi:hypothetical protein
MVKKFNADEAAWAAACGTCDCGPQATMADDGKSGHDIQIDCVHTNPGPGSCKTYVP